MSLDEDLDLKSKESKVGLEASPFPKESLIGKKFGKWLVLGFAGSRSGGKENKIKTPYWHCLCDCGIIKATNAGNLIRGKSKGCGKCSAQRPSANNTTFPIPSRFWFRIKDGAKNRGLAFEITSETAVAVYKAQNGKCAFSGNDIDFAETNEEHIAGGTTASLDRIDSSLGYIDGNIQWVRKDLNKLKGKLKDQVFIKICCDIAKHRGNLIEKDNKNEN